MPKRRSRKSTAQSRTKKPKVTSIDKEELDIPVGSSYLELLPKEILELIYNYLPTADILKLMLTSKTIKNFIEQNFSNHFTVRFSNSRRRKHWIGTRAYPNVIFDTQLPSNFVQHFVGILKTFGSEVKNLTLNCKVMEGELMEILKICKNVECFKYATAIYHHPTEFEIQSDIDRELEVAKALSMTYPPLEFPNLKSLYNYDFGKSFGVFSDCQFKGFYQRHLSPYFNEPELRDTRVKSFLLKQEHLESLALWHCTQEGKLFENSELSNVKFKLKSLQLCYFNMNGIQIRNFGLFLETQKETLTHLELFDLYFGTGRVFNICENLKVINVNSVDFEALSEVQLDSVESLTCDQNDLKRVDEIFPNLKELTVKIFKFDENQPSFEKLEFLEKLTLEYCDKIPKLKIPSVKVLKFIKCDFTEGSNPVDWSENNLNELIVENCVEPKWIHDNFFLDNVNLSLLKLINLEFLNIAKETLENNREKFKILIITGDVKFCDEKKFIQLSNTRNKSLKRLWGDPWMFGRPKAYFE